MATPKLLSLSKLLRRRRPTLFISSSRPLCYAHSSNLSTPRCVSQPTLSTLHPFASSYFFLDRSLFTRSSEHGRGLDPGGGESAAPLGQEEGLSGLGLVAGDGDDGSNGSEVAEALNSVGEAGAFEESLLPVNAVISFLDWYRDLTGFPWWVIIASSTFALRVTLLPVLILQLKKLREIAELFPKLPPPFPPPLSGKSYMDQLSLFHKERKAVGCPSYLWFISYVLVQVPCFLLWMTSIRRMSLNHHPGFECGGALWFQNLTEFPHGILGPLFPLIIGSLHFVNVKFSFQTSSVGKVPGLFGLLTKYYKFYLNLLTLPIILIGFCIPQGSLVYWVTNSSLTLIQQITLKNLNVREKLGLLDKGAPVTTANPKEIDIPRGTQQDQLRQGGTISVQHLSPEELLVLSVQLLAKGRKDGAFPLLRLALDKDPEYVRALVVMGQALLQNGQEAKAIEYLESAISKLFLLGHPTEVEEVDMLILASQWAGVAYIRQGNKAEGIRHLERVAHLKEPEDSKSKAHYYDGLLLLASALYGEGRKPEAAKYLRLAVAYDPSYNEFLEQCEKDEDSFVDDLVSSRRGDY